MEWFAVWFSAVDWSAVLVPSTPLLETFIRGTVIYLSLFFILRFVLKRQAGSMGITDLLVIVLIADAAQNGMADDYKSLPDALALIGTLIFWNFTLEWLSFHFRIFDRVIVPAPLPLIKHGRMIRKNMQEELITKEELLSQLRQQGVEEIASVKSACLEADGKISVIKAKNQ